MIFFLAGEVAALVTSWLQGREKYEENHKTIFQAYLNEI